MTFFRPLILLSCTLSLVCAQEIHSLEKIEVQEDVMTLEERKENSISKRIIKSEELAQYGDLNALEMLKRTPGVTIAAGKKGGVPGKGYTKVLVDGEEVSTNSNRRNSPLEQISPDMIERVEIMTNGSAEYSAESIGGIVNIVLKKPKSDGIAIVKASGGVYNSSGQATLFGQYEKKYGDISMMVNATMTDVGKDDVWSLSDTQSGVTTSQNNTVDSISRGAGMNTKFIYSADKFNKYTLDGTLGYWRSSADETSVATSLGVTTKNANEQRNADGYYYALKLSGDHNMGQAMMVDWKLIAHGSGSDMKKTATQSVTPSTIVDQDDSTLFGIYGGNVNLSYLFNTHFIKSGIEYRYSKNSDNVQTLRDGVEVTQPTDNVFMYQNKYALYLQDEYSVSEVFVLTPGIRYEKVDRDYGSVSSIDYFAPSLHALFKLTPNDNLRASVAKTVKLPRLDEISTSVNRTLSDNTIDNPDTTGNIDLTQETAISYELRAEHYFEDKGIVSASGFYRDISDKIEKLTTLEAGRYIKKPSNSGEGKLWGLELELKKPIPFILEGLGVWGNATFQNSTLHNNATGFSGVIGETSDVVANIGVDHSFTPYHLTYGVGYRYDGGFNDPIDQSGIEKSQKAFGVLDLYATKKLDSIFKLTFNAKNMANETIRTTSNRYSSGTLVQTQIENANSQRQFLLTLEGKW